MLQRFEAILLDPDQEVRPSRRVCCIPRRFPFRAGTAVKRDPVIDIFHWENGRICVLPCRLTADCGIVIQNPNTTTKSAYDEVILSRLNLEVAHGNRRDATDFVPSLAFIRGDIETCLRSDKEQLWINMILHNRQCGCALWQVARDRFPSLALIGALHDIRLVVTIFVVVKESIDGVCRMP